MIRLIQAIVCDPEVADLNAGLRQLEQNKKTRVLRIFEVEQSVWDAGL